jgi:glutamyl-tRNA reductase
VVQKHGEVLTKKQLKAVEDMSKAIVNKMLHGPMTALRCDPSDPDAVNETLANMEALERMFGLSTFEEKVPAPQPPRR